MHKDIFEIENALDAIEFYQYHPEYRPFVGDQYDDFKILQIGESHYIPQTKDEETFSIEYFEKQWWQKNGCTELNAKQWGGWYNTKGVLEDYLSGKRTRAHGIFTEMVKLFSRVYTDTPIKSITKENSQAYHHFAFMNFYQMPSLYKGVSYWDSLVKSAKKALNNDRKQAEIWAGKVWTDTAKRSKQILDQVIDILDPQVIIFTSKSAYEAYINLGGKHATRKGVFRCVHPGSKYWHKPTDDQTGKQELEKALNAFLGK